MDEQNKPTEWESVVEWLHGHSSRVILIKPSGHKGEDGEWVPRPNNATFTLVTRLPDGRKVMSSVEILDEMMIEPKAGDFIVHEAKIAIANLLRQPEPPEVK